MPNIFCAVICLTHGSDGKRINKILLLCSLHILQEDY